MGNWRFYDASKDKDAIHRIWREVGWVHDKYESMDLLVGAGKALVADLGESPECLTLSATGDIQYLGERLPFAGVTGVTTSHVARRRSLARRLTARLIAENAAEGATVVGLGMFDQGFYNQLGLGSGSYEHHLGFDPAQLTVEGRFRAPKRLGNDDWQLLHDGRVGRMRGHGSISFCSADLTRSQMLETENGFGFGYVDDDGHLTHGLWLGGGSGHSEYGPYSVHTTFYQSYDQLFELLAFIKSLGDQIRSIRMSEPSGLQFQDLISQPFRGRSLTRQSPMAQYHRASAWWQMRVCDLDATLRSTHVRGNGVRFNLVLEDPITRFLGATAPWQGVAGSYVVNLGDESGVTTDQDSALPTLVATVNAWTRMWLGVRPASSLAFTDKLSGPPELLKALDEVLCLPQPHVEWGF